MNERQKKIMVPYQEPTDTCPDCSEHPCDCGIPAGYQSDIRFAANFAPHIKVIEASKVAEIIEQRDRLAELAVILDGYTIKVRQGDFSPHLRFGSERDLVRLDLWGCDRFGRKAASSSLRDLQCHILSPAVLGGL